MKNRFGWSVLCALGVIFPAAAWADINSNQTLSANTRFSFDTGSTVTSGGDILFTGTSITFQGSATGYSLGSGSATYSAFTQAILSEFSSLYNASAITGSSLAVNNVFAVHTLGGNYAKVLITAVSSTSLSFMFDTFGATGGAPGAPSISAVLNNYSGILPGLPNYGIAPGSVFVIYGSGLSATATAVLQSSAAPGIPLTLNGATVSVTVGSVTTHPGLYYVTPTQVAAVLPSSTPVGTGTISVNYNNLTGTAPIQVVSSALGLDTLYQTGTGLGVATIGATVINYNVSASPGQTITLWGSGLGADTADSDTVFTSTPHSVSAPLQIYIGGVLATIGYQGGSGYPGVNQINVTIPTTVPTGCGVSVVAVSGSGATAIVSNTVSLPINPGGGVCSDPALGVTGTQLISQSGQTTTPAYSFGSLSVIRGTEATTTAGSIDAAFYHYSTTTTTYSGFSSPSLGSCIVLQSAPSSITTTPTLPVGLDAGTITVTGPGGSQQVPNESIPGTTGPSGVYFLQPSSTFLPATFGTFTFTGSGGKEVGPFTASISYNNPLNWTNMNSITSVTRSQGQGITWTGGASGTYVYIFGGSSNAIGSVTVSFECYAPVNQDQFTIPSYVLLALPAGSGSLSVYNFTAPQSFTATGLTTAEAEGGVSFGITPSYQ